MKKYIVLLSLIAPSFSFAGLLVSGDYEQGNKKVSVADLRDGEGQLIQIKENGHIIFRGELSDHSFSVYQKCENGFSNVTEMGYLIEANCNTADGDRFRLFVDQENGIVKAIHTVHETPGLFGGGYKIKNQDSIRALEQK